jgi:CDP-glucose 4,6-dehydratase
MMLAQQLAEGPHDQPLAYNFGPDHNSTLSVGEVIDVLNGELGIGAGWQQAEGYHPPEAPALALDSSLAIEKLGWQPKLAMADTIRWTAEWYRQWHNGADAKAITLDQINRYMAL